uniref:Uncharacterized protein n=1 Tax=Sphaeramia orbicularis TaxID=375764 RepID=A0A672YEP5_9TELE
DGLVSTSYLCCFLFFKSASRRERFNLVRFLINSFLFTIAVASRVSLSAFGFLCSFSIFLSVSSSPLTGLNTK